MTLDSFLNMMSHLQSITLIEKADDFAIYIVDDIDWPSRWKYQGYSTKWNIAVAEESLDKVKEELNRINQYNYISPKDIYNHALNNDLWFTTEIPNWLAELLGFGYYDFSDIEQKAVKLIEHTSNDSMYIKVYSVWFNKIMNLIVVKVGSLVDAYVVNKKNYKQMLTYLSKLRIDAMEIEEVKWTEVNKELSIVSGYIIEEVINEGNIHK